MTLWDRIITHAFAIHPFLGWVALIAAFACSILVCLIPFFIVQAIFNLLGKWSK